MDPLTGSYPWYTPYQFAGNKPIWAVDLDGLEELSSKERNGEGVYHIGALIIQDGVEYQFQGEGKWVRVYSGEYRGGTLYSTKNLWKDLSRGYNRNNGYTYTAAELEMRYHFLNSNNPIGRAILIFERLGKAEPISRVQGEFKYGGSNQLQLSAWARYGSMASAFISPAQGFGKLPMKQAKGFNLKPRNSEMKALEVEVRSTASSMQNAGQSPATVVGARLPNGAKKIGTSGAPPSKISPALNKSANKIGGIGTERSGATIGCCAEFKTGNKLLLDNPGFKPSELQFTPAIRPRTGQVVQPCQNCQDIFNIKPSN